MSEERAMTGKRIGWIGLGAIGTQMVLRLLGAGEAVTVYARGAGLDAVTAAGATRSADYAALAAQSDVLTLCVYSDTQMTDVLLGQGALAALRPGSTLVIHTTGSPQVTRDIAAKAPAGVAVIDACFSGGPQDAAAARLTLMIGGDDAALEAVTPLLRHYAAHIHHLGPTGHGQTIKLLNNLLFATNYMNTVEMLRLAQAQGFSTSAVAQVLATCSGSSFPMTLFTHAAPLDAMDAGIRPYMEKDVATAIAAARDAGLDMAGFAPAERYFATQTAKGATA